jgi:uncharacterized protein (TIGR02231 family)
VTETLGTGQVLDAPIVAVTVYPDRARVTRRGALDLPAGDHRVALEPLPLGLHHDSVRVSGRGPATVLGVDVQVRQHPRTPDPAVAELEEQRRLLRAGLAELADADGVQAQLVEFLEQLVQRAGGSYARALASGEADPAGVAAFADSIADRMAAVRARQRELAQQRDLVSDQLAAVERRLDELSAQRRPDRMAVVVSLAVQAPAEVELEVSYVVSGARWESAYDVRLVAETLALTWYGMVSQQTGEDWPECELSLSTARPSAAASVPELDPWFLDRRRPVPPPVPLPARERAVFGVQAMSAPAGSADVVTMHKVEEAVATVEQGVSAATYRPARPVAVPADGAAHRTTVAVLELTSTLDYVTAPVRSTDAHLRATVVNSSTHTLLPGRAGVFHETEFVGSATLPVWAPGEEVELALGVDDRVRVERELVRRTASKVTLGTTRRRELEYRTKVTNHTPRPARVTVLDQLPVSRDDQIVVRELRLEPEPAERTEMGVVTWKLELTPGQTRELYLGMRVEVGKGVELAGWRE